MQELPTQLDQQAQAQQAALPYEQRYEELSRILSVLAHEQADARGLPTYSDFVERVLHDYQQHPGLATGDATARRRLAGLQQLCTELTAAYQTLLARQQQELDWKTHAQAQAQPRP